MLDQGNFRQKISKDGHGHFRCFRLEKMLFVEEVFVPTGLFKCMDLPAMLGDFW